MLAALEALRQNAGFEHCVKQELQETTVDLELVCTLCCEVLGAKLRHVLIQALIDEEAEVCRTAHRFKSILTLHITLSFVTGRQCRHRTGVAIQAGRDICFSLP